MAYQVADITVVSKQVAMALIANPDDGSYAAASATDQMKYHPTEITDACLIIDAEVVATILEAPGNGFRNALLTNSADLAYGAQVPVHPGKIGTVEIKLASAAYAPGILAHNLDVIRKLKANPDSIYGGATDTEGRYYISEEGKIYFTGVAARIQIAPDFVIGATLQSPQRYTATVIRGTLAFLRKDGIEAGFFEFWQRSYDRDIEMIKGGSMAVPALEQYKRAGG